MLTTPALTAPASNPNASGLARRSTNGFSTTLSAALTAGSQIMQPVSVSGLSTDTAVTLVIDPGTAKQETVIGWVESGNIVNMARGTEGSDQDHANGAIVVDYQTAMWANSIVDFLLADHNPDGTHNPSFLVGEIKMWPLLTAPDANWLICQGQSVLRADYPELFALIGTTYGSVDSTHFTMPDYKGRVPVGVDSGQSEFNGMGETGGEKTHTLTTPEMPAHTHNINYSPDNTPGGSFSSIPYLGGTGSVKVTESTGGGGAHNNLQPYITTTFIIRALP